MVNSNRKVSLEGVRYAQGVVENNNCSFQRFDHENDQGNDCYIEFVTDKVATNYGVFAQIKSGQSYKDQIGYKIPADKEHLHYWNQSLYKTIGIVFDPEISKAFWVDISAYVKERPAILLQENHVIRVSSNCEFSEVTFESFKTYCFQYKSELKSYENYGRSLDLFANIDEPAACYEGLKALYSNHRDKDATWFYIISSFVKIKEEGIRRNILGLLSNYMERDGIFWHQDNIKFLTDAKKRASIAKLVSDTFGLREVKVMLPYMRDGISRGSFSYLVFRVPSAIENVHILLKEISFSDGIEEDDRNFYFWLYMHIAKYHSVQETIDCIEEYLTKYPHGNEDEAILGVRESIRVGELIPIGLF